jgi:hypothetical protein
LRWLEEAENDLRELKEKRWGEGHIIEENKVKVLREQ